MAPQGGDRSVASIVSGAFRRLGAEPSCQVKDSLRTTSTDTAKKTPANREPGRRLTGKSRAWGNSRALGVPEAPVTRSYGQKPSVSRVFTWYGTREFPSRETCSGIVRCICVCSWRCSIMRPFENQRNPVGLMIEDAFILLTPVILMLVGFLLLE